ncbi:MAG TPA: helix-turn-helix transcriptional regulator [Thermoanaerobaculia bacterium]|jgi:transcriptional regulator with XRE-family HTH domain|nr:helix-turn-helix transcriptional regulator [Thermoanaerobaculia bacterium]
MDAGFFQDRVKGWRIAAELTQVELDEACGFSKGTVGDIEQGKKPLSEEQLVAIVICTSRDLLPTLMESFGSLYKRLQPFEAPLRRRFGKEPPPLPPDETEEYRQGRDRLFSGADILLRKLLIVSDRKAFLAEVLLDAAARDARSDKPKPQRVKKKGGTRKKRRQKTPAHADTT